jgi:hypothetical protein
MMADEGTNSLDMITPIKNAENIDGNRSTTQSINRETRRKFERTRV